MDDNLQVPVMERFNRFMKDGKRVTSSDEGGGFLVDSLEAQLYPDGLSAVQV